MDVTTAQNDVKTQALRWYDAFGVTPLPIKKNTKISAIKWAHVQEHRPPRGVVLKWFSRNDVDLALMCGQVSNGLCVLDFDRMDLYEHWRDVHKYHHAETYSVKTRRGVHCYFWLDRLPDGTKIGDKLDVKATGYVVAPPSPGYSVLQDAPVLRASVVEALLAGLEIEHEKAENKGEEKVRDTPTSLHFRPNSALSRTRLPPNIIARIKAALSIETVCNWYTTMRPGPSGYLWGKCPAHDDTKPSFSCDPTKERAHCWSQGCKLHGQAGLDVIDLVGKLEGYKPREAMAALGLKLGLIEEGT